MPKRVILLFLIIFATLNLKAEGKYTFNHFDTNDGLSQNSAQ